MKIRAGWLLVLVVVVLAACAPGVNEQLDKAAPGGGVAGFWLGLWHGVIAPVTFVISLFSERTEMYEVHNNGGWYNAGFLIGLSCIFGGGGAGGASARRRS